MLPPHPPTKVVNAALYHTQEGTPTLAVQPRYVPTHLLPPLSFPLGSSLLSFLFLENAKVAVPGPLRLLFPLLGTIFSQVSFHVASFLLLGTRLNVTSLEGPSSVIGPPLS